MGHIKAYPDIHIGELYENYPVFDIYDMGDSRTYQNFFFRERPFSHADLEQRATIPSRFNYCMVHEHIAEEFLPVLYYEGTGDYMLLATAKKTRTDTSGVCR